MRRKHDYKSDLLADLRNDPEFAAAYLSAAKADSKEAFLVALRDVAEARKGMKAVAREANVNRENLYRALSRKGNPSIDTVDSVLSALGMGIRFFVKRALARTGNAEPRTLNTGSLTFRSGAILATRCGKYVTATTEAACGYHAVGDRAAAALVPLQLLIATEGNDRVLLGR